jgi:hypothetical protein
MLFFLFYYLCMQFTIGKFQRKLKANENMNFTNYDIYIWTYMFWIVIALDRNSIGS